MMSNPYSAPSGSSVSESKLPSKTPKSVLPKVFGILNLVFGCFGILGMCGGVAGLVGMIAMSDMIPGSDPQAQQLKDQFAFSGLEIGVMAGNMVLGLIVTVILIAAGYFLLKYKKVGKKLSQIYCVTSVLLTLIWTPLNFFVVTIPMLERSNQMETMPIQIFSAILGVVFALIYPAVLFVFSMGQSFSADLVD